MAALGVFQILQFYNLFSFFFLHYGRSSGFSKALKGNLKHTTMPREHTPSYSPLGKIAWTYQMLHLKGQVNPILVWLPRPGGICWIYSKDHSDWFFHFFNMLPDTCYHGFCSCLVSLPSLFGCSVVRSSMGWFFHSDSFVSTRLLGKASQQPLSQPTLPVLNAAALAEWLGCFLQLWEKPV